MYSFFSPVSSLTSSMYLWKHFTGRKLASELCMMGTRMPRVWWVPECHVYDGYQNATCMMGMRMPRVWWVPECHVNCIIIIDIGIVFWNMTLEHFNTGPWIIIWEYRALWYILSTTGYVKHRMTSAFSVSGWPQCIIPYFDTGQNDHSVINRSSGPTFPYAMAVSEQGAFLVSVHCGSPTALCFSLHRITLRCTGCWFFTTV